MKAFMLGLAFMLTVTLVVLGLGRSATTTTKTQGLDWKTLMRDN